MARLQGRIVINPKVLTDNRDALAIAYNEAYRMVMEANNFEPMAEPTEEQKQFFADTAYANDPLQLKRTITARIATYDDSVPNPTPEQYQDVVNMLEMVQQAGVIQNQEEEDVVSSTLEDMAEKAGQMEQLNPTGEEAMPVEPGAMEPGAMPVEPGAMPAEQGAMPMEQGAEGPMPQGVDPAMLQQLMVGGEGASGVNEQLMAQAADKGGKTATEYALLWSTEDNPNRELDNNDLELRRQAIEGYVSKNLDSNNPYASSVEDFLVRQKKLQDASVATTPEAPASTPAPKQPEPQKWDFSGALGKMNAKSVGARSYTDASGKRITEYQPVEGLDAARAISQSNNSASGRILRMADMAQKNGGIDYIIGRLNDEKVGTGVRRNIEKQLASFESLKESYEKGGLIQYDEGGDVINAPEGWKERIAAANMLRKALSEEVNNSNKGQPTEPPTGTTTETEPPTEPLTGPTTETEQQTKQPISLTELARQQTDNGQDGSDIFGEVNDMLASGRISERDALNKKRAIVKDKLGTYSNEQKEGIYRYYRLNDDSGLPEDLKGMDRDTLNQIIFDEHGGLGRLIAHDGGEYVDRVDEILRENGTVDGSYLPKLDSLANNRPKAKEQVDETVDDKKVGNKYDVLGAPGERYITPNTGDQILLPRDEITNPYKKEITGIQDRLNDRRISRRGAAKEADAFIEKTAKNYTADEAEGIIAFAYTGKKDLLPAGLKELSDDEIATFIFGGDDVGYNTSLLGELRKRAAKDKSIEDVINRYTSIAMESGTFDPEDIDNRSVFNNYGSRVASRNQISDQIRQGIRDISGVHKDSPRRKYGRKKLFNTK